MQNSARNWLPVLAIAAILALYWTGRLSELYVGSVLIAACVLAPGVLAARALEALIDQTAMRAALWTIVAGSIAVGAIPIYFALYPGQPAFEGQVSEAARTLALGKVSPGAYILSVEGALPEREGEVTADYRLKISSDGGQETIDGALWRRFDQVRVGRRGTATQEHHRTIERHAISLRGGDTEIALLKSSPELAQGVHFKLHKTLMPAALFWGLAVALFLAAAALEARYATEKSRSILTAAVGGVLFLGWMFPDQFSHDSYLRPVFGAALASAIVGLFAGGVISWVARRLVKPLAMMPGAQRRAGAS